MAPLTSDKKRNLTEGPIVKPLLYLSLPIMASSAMQTAYNVADTFWLGRVGAQAVAALSISWPLIFLLISIAGGVSMAGTTLVAQYTGREESEKANFIASQVFTLLLSLGIVFAALGVVLVRPLLILMGAPPDVLPLATIYAQIIFGGVVLMFGFYVFQAIISGYGDTVTPMKLMLISVIINIVLDPFLIFGLGPFPKMGVAGAAVATVFSRGVASMIGFYFLFSGRKGVTVSVKELKPELQTISRITQIGAPTAVEQSMLALGFTFMAAIVAGFGTNALAAYGIGSRLISILSMPAMGFSMAVSIMIGQNLGAGEDGRAERIAWISSGTILLVLMVGGAIAFVIARPLISVFIIKEDYMVVELGSRFLKIIAFGLGGFGLRVVMGGVFRGAGDTVTAMVLSIVALWGLRIPFAIGLSSQMDTDGIWISYLLSDVLAAIVAALWLKRGGWKKKSVAGRGWESEKVAVEWTQTPED